jgi:hypothetical protein
MIVEKIQFFAPATHNPSAAKTNQKEIYLKSIIRPTTVVGSRRKPTEALFPRNFSHLKKPGEASFLELTLNFILSNENSNFPVEGSSLLVDHGGLGRF